MGTHILNSANEEPKKEIADRQRVEDELRQEERFRIAANSAPVMLWMAGADKSRDWFNKGWLDFTGRSMEQEVGDGWAAGVHPDDLERCLNIYFTAFKARQPFEMSYRLRRQDGRYRWIADRGKPRFLPDGAFAGYVGSCVDSDDRFQAEEALRQSEERFRVMADLAPAMVWTTAPDGTITYANEQWFQYCGVTPEQNAQSWPEIVLHPDDYERCMRQWKQALQLGTEYEIEVRNRRYDGEYRWFLTRAIPARDAAGRITAWFGTTTDIHDRKQSEEARARLNQELNRRVTELQTLLDVLPVGIAVAHDRDCLNMTINPTGARLLNIPLDKNPSKSQPDADTLPFKIMQGNQEVPPAELPMQYAAAQGVSVRDVEVEVVHSDGLRLNLLEYATPLYDEQAQVRGCLGVFVDITQRKTAEHRLAIQYTVARALAESTGSDEASVKVLQAMCEVTGWEFGALWRVDTDAGLLHNVSIWQSPQLRADLFAAETQTITFAVGQGLPGRVLAAGQPIWIPDVTADDIFQRAEAAAKSGLHGALAFPIRSKGEISGVLECFSRNIQQPTADVIELLDAIGNQLGVFMEHKRAEEALRLSLRKTRELYEVSQNISLVRTPTETLQVLLASSYLNHATRASVAIFNANWLEGHRPESCTIVTAWNRDPETALHIGEQMTLEEYGVVDTYAGYEPLVIDDIRNDPRVSESMRRRLLTLGTASSILFPLIASGAWYGMLSLHFNVAKMMQAEDIRHLRSLVDEAATAIYNLRSLEAEARARREAERANSLKMKFLAMISHELRTPLTSIKGFATTLLADDVTWEPESQRDFIQTMNAEADKLSDLIEQLLDLSRLEAGAIRIVTQVETWDNILTTANAQLNALTVDHPLIVDAPADLPSLKVDAARVAQVITNLVSNATKYSPPYTVITLAAAQLDERYVKVSVSDEGPGIPLAARSRAFEAFQQLHHEKNDSKGAGLGLAICRGLVEAHGGRIWIEDHVGSGTTICFTLPIY